MQNFQCMFSFIPIINLWLGFRTKIYQSRKYWIRCSVKRERVQNCCFILQNLFCQQETKKIIVEMTLNLETPLMPFFREIFIFTLGVTLIFSLLLHEHSVEFWDLFPKITFFSLLMWRYIILWMQCLWV